MTHQPASGELLRLQVLAARLYHLHGIRQREIGDRLGMSQARVSRLLQQAEESGIVGTVVAVPEGMRPELEDAVESAYGVQEVHVVDVVDADLASELGRTAARYFREGTLGGPVIGYTSWSRTLQEMAHALTAVSRSSTRHVVEMLGDLGSPLLKHAAARSTQAMATALGGEAVFLRTPGVVTSPEIRSAALHDPHVQRALGLLDTVDVALIGVGPARLHTFLQAGDSYFTPEQLEQIRADRAGGQINQRFIDAHGQPVVSPLDDLVVGSTLDQVRAARRRVVVAGGPDKHEAIAAALAGGWVDLLVTDVGTARYLVDRIDHTRPLAPTNSTM